MQKNRKSKHYCGKVLLSSSHVKGFHAGFDPQSQDGTIPLIAFESERNPKMGILSLIYENIKAFFSDVYV